MDGFEPGEEGGEAVVVLVGGEADFVVEIWAGGGCYEGFETRRVEAKGGDDVVTDREGGGCGEADYGDRRERGAEVGEMGVGGAEIVAPL